MANQVKRCTLAVVATLTLASTSFAWNDTGHQIVALLAFQELDAGTQKRILIILADHPHYKEYFLANKSKKPIDSDDIAMRAATWSDWVRSNHTKQFHKSDWHYINKPYVVAKNDNKRQELLDTFNKNKNRGRIPEKIPDALKVIKPAATTDQEKQERAVMLCWLFHLVGDLHQPLHAVALVNEALPDGDRGGNSVWVSARKGQAPKPLHTVWDHLLGNHKDVRGIVRDISMSVKVCSDDRKQLDPAAWADESTTLARRNGYNFRGKPIEFVIDTNARDGAPSSAPILPTGYLEVGEEIARQRVAVAGARLAELLKSVFAD
jgi:hypothetical protein